MSIVEDEGRSFAAIPNDFDQRKLDLNSIMHYLVTSKPWVICGEKGDSTPSCKSLFRNNLQLLSPAPVTNTVPADIGCCTVDAMRVVGIIPTSGLPSTTYKAWADRIVNYLRELPGSSVHLVFDDYSPPQNQHYLSKGRPDKGRERRICDLSQQLPSLSEWNDFLTNDINKLQLTHLLADYILSGKSDLHKEAYVTKSHHCYCVTYPQHTASEVVDLYSSRREGDPRLAFHAVFATSRHPTCTVADDTDIFILLLYVAKKMWENLYFRQGTVLSRPGVTYHNVKALADHLGESVCNINPAFHALTGSDFAQPFFVRSKFTFHKKMQKIQSISQLDTLGSLHANQTTITD